MGVTQTPVYHLVPKFVLHHMCAQTRYLSMPLAPQSAPLPVNQGHRSGAYSVTRADGLSKQLRIERFPSRRTKPRRRAHGQSQFLEFSETHSRSLPHAGSPALSSLCTTARYQGSSRRRQPGDPPRSQVSRQAQPANLNRGHVTSKVASSWHLHGYL